MIEKLPDWLSPEQVVELAKKHGSPLYVYSREALKKQTKEVLGMKMPYGFTVRYAMKANPHPEILKLFKEEGLHIDASSGYEAEKALEAGFEPSHVLITAQQLPRNLEELVSKGVLFNATSLHQLETYCRLFPGGNVSVRINPGIGDGGTKKTNTGGPNSSFGIWHEYIPQAQQIAEAAGVTIDRVHTHIGSGTNPQKWQGAAETSLEIVERFPTATTLDLGGGFKVGRMQGEDSADMTAIGVRLEHLLKQFASRTGRELHLEIEPGTFLVANAGALIAQVIDLKDTGSLGNKFAVLDTGMNDLMRPSLYAAQHPLASIKSDGTLPSAQSELVVVGHNCESGDLFTPDDDDAETLMPRLIGDVAIGDYMVVGGAGAYGAAMAAHGYNSYPSAEEILI